MLTLSRNLELYAQPVFAMLVLRFKYKGERGWRVPPISKIGKVEIPIGLVSVFLVLLSVAW